MDSRSLPWLNATAVFFKAGSLVMGGINAAVVGVLGAALYDPVWTSAMHSRADFGLALAAFGLLVYARTSPVVVVVMAAAAGWAMSLWAHATLANRCAPGGRDLQRPAAIRLKFDRRLLV